MLAGIPFSLYFGSNDEFALIISSGITLTAGGSLWFFNRKLKDKQMGKREGYLIVSLTWIIMSVFGALPYIISGSVPSFTNAFFETISGFSTTGASILTDIESIPRGILFWRSMTHWIGGMGIIVLSVAILPFLGTGGMQLFSAESSGPIKDKLNPRIQSTAKSFWSIYVILTLIETILLLFGGMDLYDALCHSFGTIATGGFSTRNDSMGAFSPFCHYVVMIFMVIAAINFTIHVLMFRGEWKKPFRDQELRLYLSIITVIGIFISITLIFTQDHNTEVAFRHGFFQVISILSTTGYATADYMTWPTYAWLILFFLMFIGGCAGSTTGSIKVIRYLMLIKTGLREFKKLLHPNAVIPIKLNGKPVSEDIIFRILAFFFIYLAIFATGTLILALSGVDFATSIGSVTATMGSIGPGLHDVGPTGNYNHIPEISKWVLSFCMLAGRLELFSILILFTPAFWKY